MFVRKLSLVCYCIVISQLGLSSTALAASKWVAGVESGLSFSAPTINVGATLALQYETFGLFSKVEWNPWILTQDPDDFIRNGTLNISFGVEVIYLKGSCRSGFGVGTSSLLFETALDPRWSTGLYVEIFPLSLRLDLWRGINLRWDSVSMHLVAPVLDGIPLAMLEYRHTVALEWDL